MGRPGCRQCCDEDVLICLIETDDNYYDANGEVLGLSISELNDNYLVQNEPNPIADIVDDFADSNEFKIPDLLLEQVEAGTAIVFEESKTPQKFQSNINKGNGFSFEIDMYPSYSQYVTRSEIYNSDRTVFARKRKLLFEGEDSVKFFYLEVSGTDITNDVEVGDWNIKIEVASDVLNVLAGRTYSFNMSKELSTLSDSSMDNFTASYFFNTSDFREFLDSVEVVSGQQYIACDDDICKIRVFNEDGETFTNLIVMKTLFDVRGFGDEPVYAVTSKYRDHRVVGGSLNIKEVDDSLEETFENICEKINKRNYGAVPSIVNALNIYKDNDTGPEDYEQLRSFSNNSFNIVIPKRTDGTDLYDEQEITDEIDSIIVQSDTLDDILFDKNEDDELIKKAVTENTISRIEDLFYIYLAGGKSSVIQSDTESQADSTVSFLNYSGVNTSIKGATPVSQIVLLSLNQIVGGADELKFSYTNEGRIDYTNPRSNNGSEEIFVNGHTTVISCEFVDNASTVSLEASLSGMQVYCDGTCNGNISSFAPNIQYTSNTGFIAYGDSRWDYSEGTGCRLANYDSCFFNIDCAQNILPEGYGICTKECGYSTETAYANEFATKALSAFNIIDQNHTYDKSYYGEGMDGAFLEKSFFSKSLSSVEDWLDQNNFSSTSVYHLDKKVYPKKVLDVFKTNAYKSQWPAVFYEERLPEFDTLQFSDFFTNRHYDEYERASNDSLYYYIIRSNGSSSCKKTYVDASVVSRSVSDPKYVLRVLNTGEANMPHIRHEQVAKKYRIVTTLDNNSERSVYEDEHDYLDLIKNGNTIQIQEKSFKITRPDCSIVFDAQRLCHDKYDLNGFKSCGSPGINYSADLELPDFYVDFFESVRCAYDLRFLPALTDNNFTIKYSNPYAGDPESNYGADYPILPNGEPLIFIDWVGYKPGFIRNDDVPSGKCATHYSRASGLRSFGPITSSSFEGISYTANIQTSRGIDYGKFIFSISIRAVSIDSCFLNYRCDQSGDNLVESIDSVSATIYIINAFDDSLVSSESFSCGDIVSQETLDLMDLGTQRGLYRSYLVVNSATITWGRIGGNIKITPLDAQIVDCGFSDPLYVDPDVNIDSARLCGKYSNFEVTIK